MKHIVIQKHLTSLSNLEKELKKSQNLSVKTDSLRTLTTNSRTELHPIEENKVSDLIQSFVVKTRKGKPPVSK